MGLERSQQIAMGPKKADDGFSDMSTALGLFGEPENQSVALVIFDIGKLLLLLRVYMQEAEM